MSLLPLLLTAILLHGVVCVDVVKLRVFGEEIARARSSRNIILVLDGSASINQDQFAIVKDATKSLLREVSKTMKVGVVLYSSSATEVCSLNSNRNKCIEKVSEIIQPRGSTQTGLALKLAQEMIPRGGKCLIITFTDGEATDDPSIVVSELINSDVVLLAIAIGVNSESENEKFMSIVSNPDYLVPLTDFDSFWDFITNLIHEIGQENKIFTNLRALVTFNRMSNFKFSDILKFEIRLEDVPANTKLSVREIPRSKMQHFWPVVKDIVEPIPLGRPKLIEIDLEPQPGANVDTLPENIEIMLSDSLGNVYGLKTVLESYLFVEEVTNKIEVAKKRLHYAEEIARLIIPVIGIVGSGKSTVINAIQYALSRVREECTRPGSGVTHTTMRPIFCEWNSLGLTFIDTKGMTDNDFTIKFLEYLLQGVVKPGDDGNNIGYDFPQRQAYRNKTTAQKERAHNLLVVVTAGTVKLLSGDDVKDSNGKFKDPNAQKLFDAVQTATQWGFAVKVVLTQMQNVDDTNAAVLKKNVNYALNLPGEAYAFSQCERTRPDQKIFSEDIQIMQLVLGLVSEPNVAFDTQYLKYGKRDEL